MSIPTTHKSEAPDGWYRGDCGVVWQHTKPMGENWKAVYIDRAATTPPGYVLDDEQVQQIILDGEKSYRQHTHRGGVRGQQFTPQDDLYWHIVKAAERALRDLTAPPIAAAKAEKGA